MDGLDGDGDSGRMSAVGELRPLVKASYLSIFQGLRLSSQFSRLLAK